MIPDTGHNGFHCTTGSIVSESRVAVRRSDPSRMCRPLVNRSVKWRMRWRRLGLGLGLTCATEIKFIQMLLEELTPNSNMKPAILLEDNTGCLYLIENQTVGNCTKHIDIRMHHIREMVSGEVPRMRMTFVRSELNFGDIMTKNVTEAIHNTLVPMLKDGRIADMIHKTVNREDVGKSGNGQKVRPKSDVSTACEPIREVAYTLEKVTKPIGVSSVGLDKSSDLNS
jgi:hypothetical protein